MRRPARFGLAVIAVAAAIRPAAAQVAVTAAAVWRPDAGFLTRFHAQCDKRGGAAFDACFAAAMAKAGASRAALEFTHRLADQAYLQAIEHSAGPLAVARVFYPFRANENSAWLLVNGTPPLIDVDDRKYLSFAKMRSSAPYLAIHRHYPKVTFWPGDRDASGPQVSRDGREFIVDYLLRDLCHACAVVGHVDYAFDFDGAGKFLGTRLASVTAADR